MPAHSTRAKAPTNIPAMNPVKISTTGLPRSPVGLLGTGRVLFLLLDVYQDVLDKVFVGGAARGRKQAHIGVDVLNIVGPERPEQFYT